MDNIPSKKYRSVCETKVGVVASIACFLLVIGCVFLNFYIVRASKAALHEPISLAKSTFYEKNFYIFVKRKYRLTIFDNEVRNESSQEIEKSLKNMNVKWQITRYGKPVNCHSTSLVEIFHSNIVGRRLCSFDASPGKYHIAFQFIEKPDDILIENSKLFLNIRKTPADDLKGVWGLRFLLFIGRCLFGGIGIICYIFAKIPKIEPPIDWSKR